MEAPIYIPAAAYEAPTILPYKLAVSSVSCGELMADPQAWAIVLKHMPMAKLFASQAAWLLGTMTIVDFALFAGGLDPKLKAAIDSELGRLPPVSARQ
jgi:hypothetical protein